jgi:hypothetical protein
MAQVTQAQPIPDSVVLSEEKTAIRPESPVRQTPESAAAKAAPPEPVLESVALSENIATAQPVLEAAQPGTPPLETPRVEAAAAAIGPEPAPVIAETPGSYEEHFSLHIVPPPEKRQPSRQYRWRKHPVALYWREVAESFLRDWRAFFASLAPQAGAFAGHVPQHADSLRRRVIAPLRTWLRTTIQNGQSRDVDPPPPVPPGKS